MLIMCVLFLDKLFVQARQPVIDEMLSLFHIRISEAYIYTLKIKTRIKVYKSLYVKIKFYKCIN